MNNIRTYVRWGTRQNSHEWMLLCLFVQTTILCFYFHSVIILSSKKNLLVTPIKLVFNYLEIFKQTNYLSNEFRVFPYSRIILCQQHFKWVISDFIATSTSSKYRSEMNSLERNFQRWLWRHNDTFWKGYNCNICPRVKRNKILVTSHPWRTLFRNKKKETFIVTFR